MPLTASAVETWCLRLLGADPTYPKLTLDQYLAGIPRLTSLADLPAGTRVLVRGDLDCKPGKEVGQGDIRLRSMLDTLRYGRERGWTQLVFGHVGRDKAATLDKVAARLGQLLGEPIELIRGWYDEAAGEVPDAVAQRVAALPAGAIVMLDNVRQLDVERLLWKADPAALPAQAAGLARACQAIADRLATVFVHEAFAAGSLDTMTVVLPAAMRRVALGQYIAGQFDGPLRRCVEAQLVVFSGVKIDKLDDLTAIIGRGHVKTVIAAGSLAMALQKAQAQLAGGDFCLGLAQDPAHADKVYYIPPARVEQAKQMLADSRRRGIEFVLPVDFVLQDGRASASIGPQDQQFDVGPQSNAHFAEAIGAFIERVQGQNPPAVAFHNGVFGMFEDPRFETGTRAFVSQLKRMTDAGVEVYVGGGEGGTALEKYGQDSWIKHCFTAGGTVLNALGSEPVPYLVALRMAAQK